MSATVSGLSVRAGAHPGIVPTLVIEAALSGPLRYEEEAAGGTFAATAVADLIAELQAAGLRGRGGAAFPTAVKLAAVRDADAPRVIVANGSEGEPSSFKDRWLLCQRPHLVLDGLLRAARAVGARRAVLYIVHPEVELVMRAAVAEHVRDPGDPEIEIHVAPDTYVAGEETAVCRSINGGPALPNDKPPRPFESGVDGRPTAVVNVETLAHLSGIARRGAEPFSRHGTETSHGTALVTLNGCCATPGVYEVPLGLPLAELYETVGGGLTDEPVAFLSGGWFGGILDWAKADVACCYEAARAIGTGLGCAAFTVIGAGEDPVRIAAELGRWYARESAQQCGVCVKGTAAIADAIGALADGGAGPETVEKLARWGQSLRRRGACALLDGAATLAATVATELEPLARNSLNSNP